MKKGFERLIYILSGISVLFLLIVLAFKINVMLNNKEQDEAIRQTEHYLAENYHDINYEIQNISSSTDFKHYGYFEHEVTVQNIDTNETFIVYYDKKMNRMEDSIIIEKQEKYIELEIKPKIEKYITENFGDTRHIYISYDVAVGKPMVVVTFEKGHKDITQTDFDTFITYLKETIGLKHANVIVDYWTRDLSFNIEF
ncbi:hypothetical protein [Gracilibacillus massiliensis]|uniref:hypothetical protein n=1 Tax=Gracilibacillus massiliensis TaxID=1564956 RepID=UPI00071E164E|nr:hypothetical protein [Gracilibacillus massiliensis]